MLTSESILSVSKDAVGSEVGGEVVLIDVESGRYFGFDAVGSEVWRRLQAPISLAALCAGLQAHFDGDPAVIQREAVGFLELLIQRGLVRVDADSLQR